MLEQGSTALVALTAIHAGLVAALFWSLLANALVATQVVEDGTLLERAEGALALLRDRMVSGEKLVWRVADE